MIKVSLIVKNQEIVPFNHKDFRLEANFDRDNPDVTTKLNKWRFTGDEAHYIVDLIEAGKNGTGPGILEGIPLQIVVTDGVNTYTLDQYLDASDDLEYEDCDDITVTSKTRKSLDLINDVADSFTYEYLFEETNLLPNSKFVFVPYIINSVPNYKESIIAIIGVFFVTTEIKNAVNAIAQIIGGISGFFTALGEVIKGAIYVIYLVTLVISLVKLIGDLIDLLIQPVKYHAGMYVKDLLEIGSQHLGFSFSSTIFSQEPFSKMVLIPRKQYNPPDPKDERILGFKNPSQNQLGYYDGTFGDLLRAMKLMFNAKIIVEDNSNTIRLERIDFYDTNGAYQIPTAGINETRKKFNTDELKSTYQIKFNTDVNDKNTIHNYTGTVYKVTQRPIQIENSDLVLMKNIERVDIPFARGARKTELTVPEKIMKAFFDVVGGLFNGLIVVVNAVIKGVNAVLGFIKKLKTILKFFGFKLKGQTRPIEPLQKVNWGTLVNDRLGMLLIENDIINENKLIIFNEASNARESKIHPSNETFLSAKYLWENFHAINSFVPSIDRPEGNQWVYKEIEKVPFCMDDFFKLINNKFVLEPEGRNAEILNVEFDPWNNLANIRYRYNETYTLNIKQTFSEANGL